MLVRPTYIPDPDGKRLTLTTIYTSDYPDPTKQVTPHKDPYIQFCLEIPGEKPFQSFDFYSKSVSHIIDIFRLGTMRVLNNNLIITITSDRKIIEAINFFQKPALEYYPFEQNTKLYENLINYKLECEDHLIEKKQNPLPRKHKKLSALKTKTDGPSLIPGNNSTSLVINKKLNKEYVYKAMGQRYISELEVFNAFCYRLLLGNRHPKAKVVYNVGYQDSKRAGLVSELVTPFTSFYDKCVKKELIVSSISLDELISSEIMKVLVAAYVEEENDLHIGNYGIGPDGFCVKIDDNQATWPLTSKYLMLDSEHGEPIFLRNPPPHNAFRVTQRDIETFPKLQDAKPYNWFDQGNDSYLFENIKEIVNHEKVIADEYNMFLKRILLPNCAYESIGQATISSEKIRKEFVAHKCAKTNTLKQVLVNTPTFQHYVMTHPNAIHTILNEFKEYNADYPKDTDANLRIDVSTIQNNFNKIQAVCSKKFHRAQEESDSIASIQNLFISTNEPSENKKNVIIPRSTSQETFDAIKQECENLSRSPIKRFPWVKDILIGFGIGIAIVGILAVTAATVGGALPIVLGVGTAIGASLGMGKIATIAGLILMSVGCVGIITGIAGLIGAIKRKFSNKKNLDPASRLNHDIPQIKKNTPQNTHQSIRTCLSNLKNTITLYTNKNHVQLQEENIETVLRFLKDKLDFFAAPFRLNDDFQSWAEQNKKALLPLSKKLKLALPLLYIQQNFEKALIGRHPNDPNCLHAGNEEEIKKLLKNNSELVTTLKTHMNDPIIAKWYQDKMTKKLDHCIEEINGNITSISAKR
ncbi:MAG: hypothetical protein A3F11_01665 [Gammaproteobacteria bacterium RIFCSPHIGHO2_12_FULL_37_14]|nr:MAG: hypothetical protein A3F11_01665 [Gammaproteobacteria bacterium RIFCSPHIGHO2_12_FULL_37_14]